MRFNFSIAMMSLLLSVSIHAQTGPDYSIRTDTRNNFDDIPFGRLVEIVFMSLAYADYHEVLSDQELALIREADQANPRLDRTYGLFEEGCNWYQQSLLSGHALDYEYMGNLLMLADEYEQQDREEPYMTAFDRLSRAAQDYILQRIEAMRGTGTMSSSTTDFRRLFMENPDSAERAYERICERLPDMLRELENWPEKKPAGTIIPLRVNQ